MAHLLRWTGPTRHAGSGSDRSRNATSNLRDRSRRWIVVRGWRRLVRSRTAAGTLQRRVPGRGRPRSGCGWECAPLPHRRRSGARRPVGHRPPQSCIRPRTSPREPIIVGCCRRSTSSAAAVSSTTAATSSQHCVLCRPRSDARDRNPTTTTGHLLCSAWSAIERAAAKRSAAQHPACVRPGRARLAERRAARGRRVLGHHLGSSGLPAPSRPPGSTGAFQTVPVPPSTLDQAGARAGSRQQRRRPDLTAGTTARTTTARPLRSPPCATDGRDVTARLTGCASIAGRKMPAAAANILARASPPRPRRCSGHRWCCGTRPRCSVALFLRPPVQPTAERRLRTFPFVSRDRTGARPTAGPVAPHWEPL